jgi:O-antigen ligase
MLTIVAIYGLFIFCCINAITRPHIGVLGYYAFVILQPEWNWRWHFPEPMGFQKYLTYATFLGMFVGYHGTPTNGLVKGAVAFLASFICLLFLSYGSSIRQAETWLYVDSLWKIALMCFLTILTIDSPKRCLALMWVLVLTQGFNAYRINENYFLNGVSSYRVTGYGLFGDNNLYSLFTLPILGCSIALVFFSKKTMHRAIAGLIMLLQAHQIMLLESRGAMLAVLFISPIVVWYMPKTRINLSALMIIFAGVVVLAGPPVVKELLSIRGDQESGELDGSAASRFELWRAGWEITKANPILGVGPWAAKFLVPSILNINSDSKSLHNIYFEISAGCGLPAAAFYFGFFAMCISAGWSVLGKTKNTQVPRDTDPTEVDILKCGGFATIVGLLGYFVASMFSAGALLESSYAVGALSLCCYRLLVAQQDLRVDELMSEEDSPWLEDEESSDWQKNPLSENLNPRSDTAAGHFS